MTTTLLDRINEKFVKGAPHLREIGLRVEAVDRGRATMVLPADPRWMGDPRRGWVHPGALTVLADSASGLACGSAMNARVPIATLDLRMDYLRAAGPDRDLRCEAECYRLTRNVAFIRSTVWQDDRAAPVAGSQATFMVIRLPDGAAKAGSAAPSSPDRAAGDDALARDWHAPPGGEPIGVEPDVPYVRFLGLRRSRTDSGTLYRLPFDERIVGNPRLPAIHGGVIAGFAETAAALHLLESVERPKFPKGVDFSIDYLRSGRAEETFASCETVRVGSRVALVQVRCWQKSPEQPIAVARAHLLLAEHGSPHAPPRQVDAY